MSATGKPDSARILAVRLGAMGDIVHALPAVASLKRGFPGARLTWVVEARWTALLQDNPFVDRVVPLRRGSLRGMAESLRELRSEGYDVAVDFQGLMKSAMTAWLAGAERIYGFDRPLVREGAAAAFYSHRTTTDAAHVVDRNLDLAAAAGAAASLRVFPLPPGEPEGNLPEGPFVLASPLAGWGSKQWPPEHYAELAERLVREMGIPLVLNGPPGAALPKGKRALEHRSGIAGLIYATRRATAVVGVDSGPLHIAAALAKPGAAIFGPTDPARNGPYGGSLRVLRSPAVETTYKRGEAIGAGMRQIAPEQVLEAIAPAIRAAREERAAQ